MTDRHHPGDVFRRLVIAKPHGFCSGVTRAVKIAESLLVDGQTVYCLHEIVHNEQVVANLAARGMKFVQDVCEVPPGSKLLFSAHGVSPEVRRAAAERMLECVDATCPFVQRVHETVRRCAGEGMQIICIGHRGHDEVTGICGEAENVIVVESEEEACGVKPSKAGTALVSQTTMDAHKAAAIREIIRNSVPDLTLPNAADVCYATRDRQEAVRELAQQVPEIIILGSKNSSNTLRLAETAKKAGAMSHLISTIGELRPLMQEVGDSVGLTSGASTPEEFLRSVAGILTGEFGFTVTEESDTGERQ